MARVAAGLALTLVEETRRLPTTAVSLPMTSVSLMLQTTMRVQQTITSLAIKGDQALSFMYPAREQPEWAVFDEDEPSKKAETSVKGDRTVEAGGIGRFALYSQPLAAAEVLEPSDIPAPSRPAKKRAKAAKATKAPAEAPAKSTVAADLDYDGLTLAQLRPRLRTLSTDEVTELLAHERAGSARSPYLTMLENRIASAPNK